MQPINNFELEQIDGGVLPALAVYGLITLGGVATGMMLGYLADKTIFSN